MLRKTLWKLPMENHGESWGSKRSSDVLIFQTYVLWFHVVWLVVSTCFNPSENMSPLEFQSTNQRNQCFKENGMKMDLVLDGKTPLETSGNRAFKKSSWRISNLAPTAGQGHGPGLSSQKNRARGTPASFAWRSTCGLWCDSRYLRSWRYPTVNGLVWVNLKNYLQIWRVSSNIPIIPINIHKLDDFPKPYRISQAENEAPAIGQAPDSYTFFGWGCLLLVLNGILNLDWAMQLF